MKKLSGKFVAGALVATSVLSLAGCVLPSPSEETSRFDPKTGIITPGENDSFDPSKNIPEDVYGPPSYWEEDNEEQDPAEERDEDRDYRPEDNVPVCVYGPPSL